MSKATSKQPAPASTAELGVNAHPVYPLALANLRKLETERVSLAEQLAALHLRTREHRPGLHPDVAGLVVGVDDVQLLPLAPDPAEVAELRRRLHNVEQAVELQQRAVERLHREASIEACKAAEPEHRKLLARVVAAVKELRAAAEAEGRFRLKLSQEGGVAIYPPIHEDLAVPLNVAAWGDDAQSFAARYLARAKEHGFD